MPKLIQPLDTGDPLGPLPQEFATIMRPELPSLIKEIGVEVTRTYPEYARLLSGPNGQAIRVGVEQSLSSFVDLVAEPSTSTSLRDDMCRRFGRFEAYEGRTMETLQGAYRLGARVALRRAKKVGRSYNFSPTLMLSFADALFAYVDELESLSREGFLEVQSQTGEQSEAMRRRLLHLILAGRPVPVPPSPNCPSRPGGRCPRRSPSSQRALPPGSTGSAPTATSWSISAIPSRIYSSRGRSTTHEEPCSTRRCSAPARRSD